MAHPYENTCNNNNNNNYASSVASFPQNQEQDEISVFLQQFLSSTTTQSSHNVQTEQSQLQQQNGRILVNESSSGGWFTNNISSSSVGTLENDQDEYDCESEEVMEGLMEETVAKMVQRRNSSKRSRAAEVHNLSEKVVTFFTLRSFKSCFFMWAFSVFCGGDLQRRRSRINEKMKALQNLIPNSNKTDKASMLDEAIEYLKQLQLQVQMLTMRNGLSLYPVCLPGMVQQDQIPQMALDMFERNKSVNMSTTQPIRTTNQDVSADNLIDFQETHANQAPDFSTHSKASFDGESSVQNNFVPFQVSRGIYREQFLPGQQLNAECSRSNLLPVGKSMSSVAFDRQSSKSEDREACLLDKNCLSGVPILPDLINTPIFPSQLKLYDEGRQATDNVKTNRN